MRNSLLSVTGLALGVGLALYGCEGEGSTSRARAALVDVQGRPVGTAELSEADAGVRIVLDLRGLPPGVHALHLHEKGRCDVPGFQSAGGHFNPFGRKHGLLNPEGPHAGDLPNITVGEDGTCKSSVFAPSVTLRAGKASLLAGEGTCLMIHAGPDDGRTDPAGGSGDRVACGAIQRERRESTTARASSSLTR